MAQHVIVVGGGVVGLCAAYELLGRGHRVTVVERGAPDHDAASLGNAGMIVPSHFEPLAAPGMVALGLRWMLRPDSPFAFRVRPSPALAAWAVRFWRAATPARVARAAPLLRDLHLRSRALYVRYAERHGNAFALDTTGLLMLCRTDEALHHEAAFAEKARALGVPAEVYDRAGAQALEPDVALDVAGAVRFPLDAHLSPHAFVADLTRRVADAGGRFVWNAEATGFRSDAGPAGRRLRAVVTGAGEIAGDAFVLAAGVFSTDVARAARLSLPMQAGKGYSMLIETPRRLRHCALLAEARVAVTPMPATLTTAVPTTGATTTGVPGGALRVGGTMEIGGRDLRVNARRVQAIRDAVPRYYPGVAATAAFDDAPVWTGLRPLPPDGMPYLGRAAAYDNLVVATGHGMMGLSLGPVTGELVADLIDGAPPAFDLTLLSPDRYR